jgi:hypothetical protein
MTGTIEWIHAVDGTVTSTEAKSPPSLEELQKYVEGYIEVVNVLVDDEPTQMIVNEEGLLRRLPVNVTASKHYATYALKEMRCFPPTPICGNAVLLRGLMLD